MKKFLSVFLLLFSGVVCAQTFPVNNLQVNGTSNFAGVATFTASPVMPTLSQGANGVQGATTAFVARHAPCPSIVDYGADPTGVNSSDSAWTAVLAAQGSANVCVFFSQGIFKFTNSLSATLPSGDATINIKGVSDGASVLVFPTASNGISISMVDQKNSFHIRDVTIETGMVGASGAGILINQTGGVASNNFAQSDITNANIRGNDGIAVSNYWSTGISITGAQAVNVINVKVDGQTASETSGGYSNLGTGMLIQGIGGSAQYAVIFNLVNVNFNYLNTGLVYGTYLQGVAIANSNFNGGQTGIVINTGSTGAAQLSVTNCQFGESLYGIHVSSGVAIGPMNIANNLFYVHAANGAAIYLQGTQGFTIMGNTIIGPGSGTSNVTGINIGQNFGLSGVVTGNMMANLNGSGSVGVLLQASSSAVNVQSNVYSSVATTVSNSGTGNTVAGGSQ